MKKLILLLLVLTATATTFAQTSPKVKQDSTKYTCPMHPEVISDKPGKCPKCGMDLVKVKTKTIAKKMLYTCPMHSSVQSDKPGSCPICGMTLVKKSD